MAARTRGAIVPGVTDMDDLVQDGWVGMLKAARTHDPSRCKISTLASLCIRGEIIDRARSLTHSRGYGAGVVLQSIDQPFSDERDEHDGHTLADRLADTLAEVPDETVTERQTIATLCQAISTLPKRQRQIVSALYFDGVHPETLAAEFGLSESRVSQIKLEAVAALRSRMAEAALGQIVTPQRRIVRALRTCAECLAQTNHIYGGRLCKSCEATRRNRLRGFNDRRRNVSPQCMTCERQRRKGERYIKGECSACAWQTKKKARAA